VTSALFLLTISGLATYLTLTERDVTAPDLIEEDELRTAFATGDLQRESW
jgi:hypothetical protein